MLLCPDVMSENKKVFFIVNKFSGPGYRDSIEGRILSASIKSGLEPTIEFTKERGHATELALGAVKAGFTRVFAVGGDGTVNETAQGLLNTDTELGIIPNGSGNGLARHLGIPMRFSSSLSMIASKHVIRMDTAMINDKISVNVTGIGFDGHVAARFGTNGKRGLPGYVNVVLKEFGGFEEFNGIAIIDGEKLPLTSFIVAIANSSQFGNNARIAPYASVCDGQLDLCLVRKAPFIRTFGFVRKVFTGRIDTSPFVSIRHVKNMELTLDAPMHFHVDGEPHLPAKYFAIKILPASLSVVVPNVARSTRTTNY